MDGALCQLGFFQSKREATDKLGGRLEWISHAPLNEGIDSEKCIVRELYL